MILKKAIITAGAIVFFQFLIVGLFPFVPPMLAWAFVVFAMFAYVLIVG